MKKLSLLLVSFVMVSATWAATKDEAKPGVTTTPVAPESVQLTAEQVAEIKGSIKKDLENWEVLDKNAYKATNEKGESVSSVVILVHTAKLLKDYEADLKLKLDEKSAKANLEFEKSKVVIPQCDQKAASVHSILPGDDKMPPIGQQNLLNPLQVEIFADAYCGK